MSDVLFVFLCFIHVLCLICLCVIVCYSYADQVLQKDTYYDSFIDHICIGHVN